MVLNKNHKKDIDYVYTEKKINFKRGTWAKISKMKNIPLAHPRHAI